MSDGLPQTAIHDGLNLLTRRIFAAGGVCEVSLLKTTKRTIRGYFDSADAAQGALNKLPRTIKAEGVYCTLNPVTPTLLARAGNRLEEYARTRATDNDIQRRLWLPIDADPVRPAGISATDPELAIARERAQAVADWLRTEHGWPDPVFASGGNSGHALYPIDEPNDVATEALVKAILAAVAQRFSDDAVTIDPAVSNAARIWTVFGTLKRKGDSTHERPHRRAWIASQPDPLVLVTRAQLEAVAALVVPSGPRRVTSVPPTAPIGTSPVLDMRAEFERRGWYLKELSSGKHAVRCPWVEAHSGESGITETVLFEPTGGSTFFGFRCQHAHCSGRTIRDVWEMVRPPLPPRTMPRLHEAPRPAPYHGVRDAHVPPDVSAPLDEMPSTFTGVDGRYTFTTLDGTVELVADHLRRQNYNLIGEIEVRCHLPGARTYGDRHVVTVTSLNCINARARQDLARLLSERARTADAVDWAGYLEDFTQRILASEREGSPSVMLHEIPRREMDTTVHVYGFPIKLAYPQIFFAPGGSGKSLLGLAVVGELGRHNVRAMFCDWELDGGEQRVRADALDLPKTIRYRRCDQPLSVLADSIKREVIEHGIEFLFIDSVAPACNGPVEDSQVALDFYSALRRIGVGSLAIAHTRSEDGEQRPFGSIFWHNLARDTWFLKRAAEHSTASRITLGVFHRKTNFKPLQPFGLEVVVESDPENPEMLAGVDVRRTDITDVQDLAASLPIRQRVMHSLQSGAKTIAELCEELDAKEDGIRKALTRGRDRTFVLITTAKDGIHRWGLAERRRAS